MHDASSVSRKVDELGHTLKEVTKSLYRSGPGGLAIHVDKRDAEEFRLGAGDTVTIKFVADCGKFYMVTETEIDAGFDRAEVRRFSEQRDWILVDSYEEEDEWSFTFKVEDGPIHITIESPVCVDGAFVNDVLIEGPALPLSSENNHYEQLLAIADESEDLQLRVRDSEGLWQRFSAKGDWPSQDPPDVETLEQLLSVSDFVSARIVATGCSMDMDVEQIGSLVDTLKEKMNGFKTND